MFLFETIAENSIHEHNYSLDILLWASNGCVKFLCHQEARGAMELKLINFMKKSVLNRILTIRKNIWEKIRLFFFVIYKWNVSMCLNNTSFYTPKSVGEEKKEIYKIVWIWSCRVDTYIILMKSNILYVTINIVLYKTSEKEKMRKKEFMADVFR